MYLHLIGVDIKSQLQFRASLLLTTVGQFLTAFGYFFYTDAQAEAFHNGVCAIGGNLGQTAEDQAAEGIVFIVNRQLELKSLGDEAKGAVCGFAATSCLVAGCGFTVGSGLGTDCGSAGSHGFISASRSCATEPGRSFAISAVPCFRASIWWPFSPGICSQPISVRSIIRSGASGGSSPVRQ